MKRVMTSLIRTAIVVLLAAVPWGAEASEDRPNIVIIVADDLGYGDLGFHGGKDIPTPHLDQLAREGVRFTSGYVSGPYCSPTRAGLFTAKYQNRFGHEFNPGQGPRAGEIGLSLAEKTIADRFRGLGYRTGLVGKWHLGGAPKFHPQQRGFEEFFGFLGGAHPYFPQEDQAPIFRGTEEVEEKEYLTDAFTREAVSFIDRHQKEPFLLLLTYNAVHNPQHAKPEHLERFKSITDETRRTYAGMLTSLDEGVGHVLEKLESAGLTKNTLVAFISDNGGPPVNGSTNGALRGQKATTWEGGVRVPFVLRWPGRLESGKEFHEPVIQLDLLPTSLAAAGAPLSDSELVDGVNLLPFLSSEKTGAPHSELYWRFGEQRAIRRGDWKLVKARGIDTPQLFNLKDDIGEQKDLTAAEPGIAAELQQKWDAWNATLVEPSWVPAAQQNGGRKAAKNRN